MVNNIYTLYNTISKRYGDVMAYPSDGFAQQRLYEALTGTKQNLKEFELCRIGHIDIESGTSETYAPIRLSWDIPLPQETEMTN